MAKFDELLSKEMTRRQFLITVGLSIVSLFGLPAVMGVLTGGGDTDKKSSMTGYGSRTYGR